VCMYVYPRWGAKTQREPEDIESDDDEDSIDPDDVVHDIWRKGSADHIKWWYPECAVRLATREEAATCVEVACVLCVAVCCRVLQCVAVCCSAAGDSGVGGHCRGCMCVVCCSLLQCVALCCSAAGNPVGGGHVCGVCMCVVCCSVLQHVVVCCGVWQCVAVCCIVLQCNPG